MLNHRSSLRAAERGAWCTLVVALLAVCAALTAVLALRSYTGQYHHSSLSDVLRFNSRPSTADVPQQSAAAPNPGVCFSQACIRAASRVLDRMDRTVDPCEDFYQYTCGQYVADHVVPEDSHYHSSMQQMQEDVLVIIKKMLDSDDSAANDTEAMGKARRLYHSCMNTSFTVHQEDMADSPIFELLTEGALGVWPMLNEDWTEEAFDLEGLMSYLTVYQVNTLFDTYITPDERNNSVYSLQFYRGSPALSRSYYLNSSSEEHVKYMGVYRALLSETLIALMPQDKKPNMTHVDKLIEFETNFANLSLSKACSGGTNITDEELQLLDDENNPRLTLAELELRFPQFSWTRFLKGTFSHYPDLTLELNSLPITVYCAPLIPQLFSLIEDTPKRVIVDYLIWRFVLRYLPYVSNYFQQLWLQFRNEVPDPFEERTYVSRWKECAALVNEGFGAALARNYARTHYDARVPEQVDEIVEQVRSAFMKVINDQEWLETDMKTVCSDKLEMMGKKIGYPSYIESLDLLNAEFDGLEILEDHFLNNILRMKSFEVWKELNKLSRPVDKNKDWMIQPLVVNAFHNPTANEIILPMGILREPFYNHEYPMYLNYGSLGVVIGHELVHGFDNHGKRYDAHGNVSQWWSDNMTQQFTERAACFVDQYSQYPIEMVNKNVDGNETLSDNICDNTGLTNAWMAYNSWSEAHGKERLLPGLNYTTEQMFLITFGQIWCEVVSKEGYEKYSTDMHSPGVYRTNVVAQNSPFFAETWGCPLGSPMNPEKKCQLWS